MADDPSTTDPRVSVILPFLNERRFLAAAVETVCQQTHTDWELLLVDDGSTDGSAEIADELVATDPRIRVLRHDGRANRGLPASRNLGLAHARGEAIAFLDADDRWVEHKLAEQLEALSRAPDVAMTCGPTWYRRGDGERGTLTPVVDAAPKVFRRGEFSRALLRRTVNPPPPSNVLFRTSALIGTGGVPDGDNLYEDQRTFFALNLDHPVHVSATPLSTYAVRPDSLYGSLADRPDVLRDQRRRFERWTVAWGMAHGRLGRQIAVEQRRRQAVWPITRRVRAALRLVVPEQRRRQLRSAVRRARRRPVRFGALRRLTPIASNWGLDRGTPVDRYFIERFIGRRTDRVRGHVLEVQDAAYTTKFGTAVERSEVLDIDGSNPLATLIADLRVPGSLPRQRYDCVIATQTLQFMDDIGASVRNLWDAVAPGGSLLVTMPTVSRLEPSLIDVERWRVTPHGLDQVLREACPGGEVEVEGYGNILVTTAFLYGLVTDELRHHELDHYDPVFPTGACGRATKPPSPPEEPPSEPVTRVVRR